MKPLACVLVVCAGLVLASRAAAADLTLNTVSVATAVDLGPQDGAFDLISTLDLGAVNNNGWTSFRTAFEFGLSGIPAGSAVHSARLTLVMSNFEGERSLEVHGYAGNGMVELDDFARAGRVASAGLGSQGTVTLVMDVSSFVAGLVAEGQGFAGFNVREDPANAANFLVMRLEGLAGNVLPLLSIEFTPPGDQIVDMDIKPGSVPNTINRASRGKIPVAILSSPTFDATAHVDISSLTFGRTGDEASLAFCDADVQDVNNDGLPDVVCHFETQAAGFLSGDTQGILKGRTQTGARFRGTDSVRVLR